MRNKSNATSELDFVYVYQGMIIPIEVKEGHNSHLRSLQIFMDEAPANIAIRVWNQPLQIDEVKTASGKSFSSAEHTILLCTHTRGYTRIVCSTIK